jgi:chromatin segregation and condensation protein Rec8/ScpA/Scc1 (kleisin family)
VLNQYIPNLDAVLFNKKTDEKRYNQGRIEIEGEIPGLVLRTPLPRFKKVTLEELMKALGNAIKTENRRIRKVVLARQQEFETAAVLPKNPINLKERINGIYARLRDIFSEREERVAFSELAGNTKDEKVATFVPLLHLDNQHKIWLEQEAHLAEIWILLKSIYEKKNAEILAAMKKEAEEAIGKLTDEEKQRAEKIEKDFENPVGEQNSIQNKSL